MMRSWQRLDRSPRASRLECYTRIRPGPDPRCSTDYREGRQNRPARSTAPHTENSKLRLPIDKRSLLQKIRHSIVISNRCYALSLACILLFIIKFVVLAHPLTNSQNVATKFGIFNAMKSRNRDIAHWLDF